MTKQVLDIAAHEVFLKGLPSHCCLFRGASKPHPLSFSSALCGSRRFETSVCPVRLDKLSSRTGQQEIRQCGRQHCQCCASTHNTHSKIGEF